jgi:hypothetical protein
MPCRYLITMISLQVLLAVLAHDGAAGDVRGPTPTQLTVSEQVPVQLHL